MKRHLTKQRIVVAIALAIVATGTIYAAVTGSLTPSSVRAWLDSLGPAAPVLFIGAFVIGSSVGLPGTAFVLGARLAFGPWAGFFLAYGGGMLAVTLPFFIARRARDGGQPWRPKGKLAARAFAKLETHPRTAVIGLRLILWFNTAVTYALAFSPVRARDYVLSCAIGLAPVVAVMVLAVGYFL